MEGTRRRPSGWLLASTAILLLATLLSVIGLSRASAAPDRGRDSRPELCANVARITFRAIGHLDSTLEELVADGTLTQQQADAVATRLTEGDANGRRGRCAGIAQSVRTTSEAVSDLLGLDWSEIRDRLKGGESLAEIAESTGVSRDELIDAMLTGVNERLDAAESDGRITPEERADREEAALARIERIVDRQRHSGDSSTPESSPQ